MGAGYHLSLSNRSGSESRSHMTMNFAAELLLQQKSTQNESLMQLTTICYEQIVFYTYTTILE